MVSARVASCDATMPWALLRDPIRCVGSPLPYAPRARGRRAALTADDDAFHPSRKHAGKRSRRRLRVASDGGPSPVRADAEHRRESRGLFLGPQRCVGSPVRGDPRGEAKACKPPINVRNRRFPATSDRGPSPSARRRRASAQGRKVACWHRGIPMQGRFLTCVRNDRGWDWEGFGISVAERNVSECSRSTFRATTSPPFFDSSFPRFRKPASPRLLVS